MVGVLDQLSSMGLSSLGISLWILIVIIIWEAIWKFIAMWIAARKNSLAWFIVLGVINTVGILPILYIFVFSKMGKKGKKK